MSSSEQLVGDYFAAWNAHDGGALASCFADDGTFEGPTTPMAIRSFDLQAVIESLATQFSDFKFELTRLTASATIAHAEWVLRGTNDGPINRGIPATGRKLHVTGVDVFD